MSYLALMYVVSTYKLHLPLFVLIRFNVVHWPVIEWTSNLCANQGPKCDAYCFIELGAKAEVRSTCALILHFCVS